MKRKFTKKAANHVFSRSPFSFFFSAFLFLSSAVGAPLAEGKAQPQFRVGVIIPLTGPVRDYGSAIQNGIELARQQNPENFAGCQFIYEDSAYNTSEAEEAFEKLQAQQASLIFAFGGPIGLALAPHAETHQVPLIVDYPNPKVSEGRKFVFRYANRIDELAESLIEVLLRRKVKEVAVVLTENVYLEDLYTAMEKAAEGKIHFQFIKKVGAGEKEFKEVVTLLQGKTYDALGLFLLSEQLTAFAGEARGVVAKKTIFGGDFFAHPVDIARSRGFYEGALFPNNIVDQGFRKRYAATFGNLVHLKFAAEAYDIANLMAELFCTGNKEIGADEVVKQLLQPKMRKGAQGKTILKVSPKNDKYFSSTVATFSASVNGAQEVE